MRQILRLCFLTFFLFANLAGKASAPPLLEWQKCLGGSNQDMPVHLIKGNDGFIYTLGSSASIDGDISINRGSHDLWFTKQDSLGNLIWQRTYGGSNMDIGTGIIQLNNGDFVLSGYTSSNNGDVSNNHGNFDAWILKINSSGNILWQKTIGGSQVDLCYSLIRLQDGGFLLGGGTYSNDGDVSGQHGDQDFWLVKMSSSGIIQWQKAMGGTGLDVCYGILENSNGDIIACGSTNSNDGDVSANHGSYDFWVNKISSTGTILWSKCFGGNEQESALSITVNSAGQYAVAGYSKSINGNVSANFGYNDFWICLIDDFGNLIKEKNYGGSGADIAYSVVATTDGGFLLVGGTNSSDINVRLNQGAEDILLVKIEGNLNLEWTQTFGGSGNDRPSCSIQNTDGGYYVGAYTYSNDGDITGNHGTSDFWILKLSCLTPIASFLSSADSVCINGVVNLINSSSNSSSYEWFINNRPFSSQIDTAVMLTRIGNNTIRLKAETCYLSNQSIKSIYVSRPIVATILSSEPYLCSGSLIELSSAHSGIYLWSNGSTSSSIIINAGGVYELNLSKGGCTATSTINVTEHSSPIFDLGPDTNICIGTSLLLIAPANMTSYTWQDGSSQNSYLATAPGLYSVTTTNQFCSYSDIVNVNMINCGAPIANFTSNTQVICENGQVTFTDLSGNASSWNWTFPGGQPSTSTQANPTITYPNAGIYAVMLEATNQAGTNILMRVQFISVNATPLKPQITVSGYQLNSTQAENYQWMLNQAPIQGALYRSYTAIQSGNYRVEISDANQCHAISDPVTILITGLPSLQAKGSGLTVYPNPTYGEVYIQDDFNKEVDAEIRLFDNKASLLYSNRIHKTNVNENTTLDLSQLPGGTYFLEYRTQSGLVTGSILIKQ